MKKKPSVLIVDDNPENLGVLGTIIAENGYTPGFAQNGAIALAAVKKKRPDLILLDVMMPDIDGFEVCRQLKQDPTFDDIPIIFLTAMADKEDVITGLELGAVDYVTKPFNNMELITRVNTHLELKAAKEALSEKVDELKQANATKDKFFAIIAHDLINPFNALLAFSSILANKHTQMPEDERDSCIQGILQASNNNYNLLKNLLHWARSQIGKLEVKPTLFDLRDSVGKNIEFHTEVSELKGVNIFSSIDSHWVFADKRMFDTVIRNLLSNAIKFTPEHGMVSISAKQKDDFVEISISDTGVGLKSEDVDKLFRIDVNQTTVGTSKEKGTGLGLILCKEFVEKNGGTIGVESEEGKGSRFYVCIPSK
jgi:two-component system sensor histidine kinase/response regulator